jgi:plastocyanin
LPRYLSTNLVLVGVLAAIAGCGSSSSNNTTSSASTPPAPATTTPSSATASSSLTIAADPSGQFAFVQKTASAKAGTVTITFQNSAPVAHNLTIADSTGAQVAATPTISGGSETLTVTLKSGTYTYFCTVPGHRAAGMQGTLTVS